MLETHPTRLLEAAVHGMLPKNRLLPGREKKLRLFDGPEHLHQSQIDDELNRMQIEALNFKWQKARPADMDPLADPQYYPGWMLHFENDGDFLVAHGMEMAPKPKSKAQLPNWRPSTQIQAFESALEKKHLRDAKREASRVVSADTSPSH